MRDWPPLARLLTLRNLPNLISAFRIALVPVLVLLLLHPGRAQREGQARKTATDNEKVGLHGCDSWLISPRGSGGQASAKND